MFGGMFKVNFRTLELTFSDTFQEEEFEDVQENPIEKIKPLDWTYIHNLPSLLFKTVGIEVFKDYDNPISQPQSEVMCSECYGKVFCYDSVRGEKICQVCGLVLEEEEYSFKSPRSFDNEKNVYHDVLSHTFKKKTIPSADLQMCSNPTDFRRRMRVDGYYNSTERKRNDVESFFNRIKKEVHIPDHIVEHSWKHYRNLENSDIFVGKRMFVVCSALIYISSLQCNHPIQMQKYVYDLSNNIEKVTKKELRRAKNHIFEESEKSGYDIGVEDVNIDSLDMIQTTINYIRAHSSNKIEEDFFTIQSETLRIMKKGRDILKYYGAITSAIPSIMYYVAKKKSIPLTYEELVKASYVSSQSIRKKYKILVKYFGDPKKKRVYTTKKQQMLLQKIRR